MFTPRGGRQVVQRALGDFEDQENAGIAFALVLAAGLATALGASIVFFPRFVKLANKQVLAGTMAFSAGVMLYISLVDIYNKSAGGFEEIHEEDDAFIYATLCFFAGLIAMFLVNRLLVDSFLLRGGSMEVSEEEAIEMGEEKAEEEMVNETGLEGNDNVTNLEVSNKEPDVRLSESRTERMSQDDDSLPKDSRILLKTGIATAVAIAIHNFPEGLITFVGYMSDPAVGVVLCIGIALHNIPEGLCVAMPVYYASGSRWKGFLWGMLSGASEPLGALMGWAVLKNSMSGNTYGILFGLVSGMMTYISIDELFPTAVRYDPHNKFTTILLSAGMLVMAVSLITFSS